MVLETTMRSLKREPASSSRSTRSQSLAVGAVEDRPTKRERVSRNRGEENLTTQASEHDAAKRRVLRSQYLAVIHDISEGRDDLFKVDSNKFDVIIHEVEKLHEQVQKPREQVADAEALQDIANTLVTSIKSQSNEGVTPVDFINCLLKEFGQSNVGITDPAQISVNWEDIGLGVSGIFNKGYGCCTMLGPMSTQLKQRKTVITRKHVRPTESARPEELVDSRTEEKTDTDKNMSTMFEILRRKKRVKLESLIMNRKSFAQTVENLFTLSFLVKDGRAEIIVDENGSHLVSPRNAPATNSIMSREVTYNHFVFRFDFKDWKRMMDVVPIGEELMPHRGCPNSTATPQQDEPEAYISQEASLPTTPIRKLSRNRGLIVQEESVVEDSPDNEAGVSKGGAAILRRKRRLTQK